MLTGIENGQRCRLAGRRLAGFRLTYAVSGSSDNRQCVSLRIRDLPRTCSSRLRMNSLHIESGIRRHHAEVDPDGL